MSKGELEVGVQGGTRGGCPRGNYRWVSKGELEVGVQGGTRGGCPREN